MSSAATAKSLSVSRICAAGLAFLNTQADLTVYAGSK